MCGLAGMAGPGITSIDLRMLQDLMYVSGLRGRDGTGVLQGRTFRKSLEYFVEKSRSEVSYFLWYHEYAKKGRNKVLDDVMANFFVGHVRAATKGRISDDNSHPFDVGRIIGCHNGTLRDKKYEDENKTDSEMMFQDINDRSLGTVLRDLDKDSAYAISLLDKRTNELIFVRNSQRTLYFTYHQKRKVFYWASEREMLLLCAARYGIEIGPINPFNTEVVYYFKPDEVQAGRVPNWRTALVGKKEEEVTVQNKQDNVLLLNPPKGTQELVRSLSDIRTRKLIQKCCNCQREMDLIDQYEGKEIDTDLFSCAECETMILEIQKQGNYKGALH